MNAINGKRHMCDLRTVADTPQERYKISQEKSFTFFHVWVPKKLGKLMYLYWLSIMNIFLYGSLMGPLFHCFDFFVFITIYTLRWWWCCNTDFLFFFYSMLSLRFFIFVCADVLRRLSVDKKINNLCLNFFIIGRLASIVERDASNADSLK